MVSVQPDHCRIEATIKRRRLLIGIHINDSLAEICLGLVSQISHSFFKLLSLIICLSFPNWHKLPVFQVLMGVVKAMRTSTALRQQELLSFLYFPTLDTIKRILALQSWWYWHNKRGGASECAPQTGSFLLVIWSSMKVVPSTLFSMDPVSTRTAAIKAGLVDTEMIGNTLLGHNLDRQADCNNRDALMTHLFHLACCCNACGKKGDSCWESCSW
jgi:hypothetical protein